MDMSQRLHVFSPICGSKLASHLRICGHVPVVDMRGRAFRAELHVQHGVCGHARISDDWVSDNRECIGGGS